MDKSEPLISIEKLRDHIFRDSFADKPHKFYVVYDENMDQLMIKLVAPEKLAVEFAIDQMFSLLVEPDSFEIVGCQFSNFTSEYLPKYKELQKVWNSKKLQRFYLKYQELEYKPKVGAEQNDYFVPIRKIESVLAAC